MAFGDWDEVTATYKNALGHKRYGKLAERMLSLVDQIRRLPTLELVIPGTSLLTLFLVVPGITTRVNVIWNEDNVYRVYLYHSELEVVEEQLVEQNEVIHVIEHYLEQLRQQPSS